MFSAILAATDDSELSRKAVETATGLARALSATLVILHVVPRYPTAYFEGGMSRDPDDIARIERQWAEQGRAAVNAAAARAEAAGVAARPVVMQSDAVAESILAAAHKHGCGLIVMASHGRRGLQRVLLGSETQHVLTRGDLPVLVLR